MSVPIIRRLHGRNRAHIITLEGETLRPLRPLRETKCILHWTTFIGPHQPKNFSASPHLRVSHRTYRYDVGSVKSEAGSDVGSQ